MIKNGYGVNFKNDPLCVITDSHNVEIATLDMENDSYYLKLDVANASAFSVTEDDNMPPISEVDSKCKGCELGKSHRLPFSKVGVTRSTHKLEIMHSDIRGPMSTASWSVQSGSTLCILRTDNGGEYMTNEFEGFLRQQSVIHQVTVPYSHQQNGVFERKNKTVMEMARSMLYEKKLPKTFWAETVATSVYLLNRLATKAMSSKTPIKAWSRTKLSIQHLKAFGSISYYRILEIKRSKLDAKARKGIFDWTMDEVKRNEDTFSNETYHDEVDIPKFDIEDTTDTDVLRTRPLIDVYKSCNSVIELESYMDASKHSEWIDAMKAIEMIKKNNTWKLVDLPKGQNAIGFEVVGQEEKVYRLYKALYGLKQAPRAWYANIDAHLLNHNFRRSSSESTFYMKHFNSKERLIIYLYVDDLLVIGSNDQLIKEFKKQMESEFDMLDMGLVSYFLGMEIKQLPNGVHISQRKYASDMLKKFKMFLCKLVTLPLVYKCKLSKDDGKKLINPTRFRSIVGSLLYLTISRPNLAFAASFLSRFMCESSSSHLGAAKRVLRYVKCSFNLGIMFKRNKVMKLEGYADSD
ncbi:retrovirus-related pol polyprotein from transposon TNT 1-94 [Tanacetum coccineum]